VTPLRRVAGPLVGLALTGLLTACGAGGFGSAPPSPATRDIGSYVALGDDFTAAPDTGTTVGDDGCRRSDVNYPALVAHDLGVTKVDDVSCAGATTGSVTTETRPAKGKPAVPPQLDAVAEDTDLVTIGAGIEDRDLFANMFNICTAMPCTNKVTPQAILKDVDTMGTSLTAAVRAVQDKAPNAYVVLVGYPNILPDSGACDAIRDLDQTTIDAANYLLDQVNREVRSTARDTGVGYLDVSRLSVGHELCSGESWIRSEKGKHGKPDVFRPEAAEQRAVADALEALVKSR
jgi:hypothetical protein